MKITTNFMHLRRNLLHRTVKNKVCSIRHIHTRSLSHRYPDNPRRGYRQRRTASPALTCAPGCQRVEGGANSACEGPQAGRLQGAARGRGGSFTAVGIAPPFLSFLRRQRSSQTLQWGPLTLVGTTSAPPGCFSVLQPSPLTEEAGFRRGDESRPRQLSTPVTGWQPIRGPSPGVARSEVRPQSGVCAGSLNPRGMTCWACFSTSGT